MNTDTHHPESAKQLRIAPLLIVFALASSCSITKTDRIHNGSNLGSSILVHNDSLFVLITNFSNTKLRFPTDYFVTTNRHPVGFEWDGITGALIALGLEYRTEQKRPGARGTSGDLLLLPSKTLETINPGSSVKRHIPLQKIVDLEFGHSDYDVRMCIYPYVEIHHPSSISARSFNPECVEVCLAPSGEVTYCEGEPADRGD